MNTARESVKEGHTKQIWSKHDVEAGKADGIKAGASKTKPVPNYIAQEKVLLIR